MHKLWTWLLLLFAAIANPLQPATPGRWDRYALVLEEPPLARQLGTAPKAWTAANQDAWRRLEAAQQLVKTRLVEAGIPVLGQTQVLLNAIYVRATETQANELRQWPGVRRVERMRSWKRHMVRALDLVNAPGAWARVGGSSQAGRGVKIAILDTGIDHTHPAFQDPSLPVPPGYPKCVASDCAFTNNKIIAARSYVDLLVLADTPEWSRPDDLSPRDHVGHGTATAMIAAGVPVSTRLGTAAGIAPKAYLGNYKIFGSPGVNDVTFDDVIFRALEDAVLDGMDVAVLPLGQPATWGPNDRGATCQLPANEPCDLRVEAVENAASLGLTVVVSAGNDGDLALEFPALTSINSPGTAPSAITVGASTNSHELASTVRVDEEHAPGALKSIRAVFGDGPKPSQPVSGRLLDVAALEPSPTACRPIAAGSLTGAIALIDRGDCSFAIKVNYAQRAGAIAVIIAQYPDLLAFPMTGLLETGIPAVMIDGAAASQLRTYLSSHPNPRVTLDPFVAELESAPSQIAYFSSRGPAIGEGAIKPELVAPAMDVYVATQDFDPNGELWSPERFIGARGTSFAAPMVAGTIALLKQAKPGLRPTQYKSLVTNTANPNLTDFDATGALIPASVTARGAGQLDAQAALAANLTVEPATLSFGYLSPAQPLPTRTLTFTNIGNQAVNVTLAVEPPDPRIQLTATTFQLGPGASQRIGVSLTSLPGPGIYEGILRVRGGTVELRVPYLYVRGDGVPSNILPLHGLDFIGNVNERLPGNLLIKVIDRYGAPVANAPIQFEPATQVEWATAATDQLGIAEASVFLGPNPGEQEFRARLVNTPDLGIRLPGRARLVPTINQGGVVNAASFPFEKFGPGIAPGAFISIYGTHLSEATRTFSTPYLPWSLAGVSVSFDVPGRGLSFPGRLHFVSETQINVQVPWELQGQASAWIKVSIGPYTSSTPYEVPIASHAPAFFEKHDLGGTGRLVAAALDENYRELSSANPARPGRVVQLYLNGLGPVDKPPPSGEPAPLNELRYTRDTPSVTIAGRPANVLFSGLAPGSAIYQVNVIIPPDTPPGLQEVRLSIGGVETKPSYLYVAGP